MEQPKEMVKLESEESITSEATSDSETSDAASDVGCSPILRDSSDVYDGVRNNSLKYRKKKPHRAVIKKGGDVAESRFKSIGPSEETETSRWPVALHRVGCALFYTLHFLHPVRLLQLIAGIFNHINNFTLSVNSRTRRRRKLLSWLRQVVPPNRQVPNLTTVWRDGTILCSVIETAIPGSCTELHRKQYPHISLQHAQKLAIVHLGVPPMFSYEDLHQLTFSVYLERRLIRYLQTFRTALTRLYYDRNSLSRRLRNFGQSIFGFTPQVKHIDRPRPPPVDCVLKGMGLIVAVQERRSIFYIYFLKPPHSNILRTYHQDYDSVPADIAVFIRGPQGDYGEVIIQNLLDHYNFKSLNFSSTKSPCNIPINYRLTKRYMRINYMPQNHGTHELAVLRQGYHLPGSPFLVTVDMRSQYAMPQTYGFSDDEECSKNKANRRRLRVMFRVVDFVTEKMLLTEDGRLEKLPVLTSERILTYRSSQSSSDRTCSSPGSIDSCEVQIQRLNRATNYDPPNKSNVFKTSPAKKAKIGKDYTNLLRGRWRKVMLLCRFFAKHSSDQRRLQILRAAGHIFDGRPVRLTESTLKLIEEAVSAMPNDKDDFTCQTPTDEIKYDSSLEINVNSTTKPPQYEASSTTSNNDKEISIPASKQDVSLLKDAGEVFETSKTSLSENTAQDQSMDGLRELYKSTSNLGLNLITHLEDEKDRAAITKRRITSSQYRKDATTTLGKLAATEFEGINIATIAVPIINSVDEIVCGDQSSNTGKNEQINGTRNKMDSTKYVSNEAEKGTLQKANDTVSQIPEEILIGKEEGSVSILTLELELKSRGDSNKGEYLESTKHTAQLQNISRMKIGTYNINRICNQGNPNDVDEVSTDINQKNEDNKIKTLSLIEEQCHKELKEMSYNTNISQENYKTSSADATGPTLTPDREESPKCRDCNVALEIITDIETKSYIPKDIPLSYGELPKECIHEIDSENNDKKQFQVLTNNEAKESMANPTINISKEEVNLLQKQSKIQTECPSAAVQAMIMRFENLQKDTSKDLLKEKVEIDISLQVNSVNNKEMQDTLSNERETTGSEGDVNTKENKQFPMKTTKGVHQCDTQAVEEQLERQIGKATPLDLEKQNKKGQTKKSNSADLNTLENEEREHETVMCNLPTQLTDNASIQRTGEEKCNFVEDLQLENVKHSQFHEKCCNIEPVESKNLEMFCSSNEHVPDNNSTTSAITFSKERTEPTSIVRDGERACVSEIQQNQERVESHAIVKDCLSDISIQNLTEYKNTLDNEYQNSAHLLEVALEQENAETPKHSLMDISNSIPSGEIPLLYNDLPVCNTFDSQLVNLEVKPNVLVTATPPFSSLCSSEGLTMIDNVANISGVTVSQEYPEECSLKIETDFKTAAIIQHCSVKQQKVTITPTFTAHAPRNAEDVEDENNYIKNAACAAKAIPKDVRGAAQPSRIPSVTNNESLLHKPAPGASPFTTTDDAEEIKKPKAPTKASQGIDVESLISAVTTAVEHNEVIKEACVKSSSNASVEIIKKELSEEKSKGCKYDSISNLEQRTNVTKERFKSPVFKKGDSMQESITAPNDITEINNHKINESEIVALVIGAEEQAQSPTNLQQKYSILNNLDKRFKDPVVNNEASVNFEEVPRCSVTSVEDSVTAKEDGAECELVCSSNGYCMPEVNEFPTDFFHNDIQESSVPLKETDIAPTIPIDPLQKCTASFMGSDVEYSIRRSDVDINGGSSTISEQSSHPDTVTEECVEILNEVADETSEKTQKRYSAIANTNMGKLSVTKELPKTSTRDKEVKSSLTRPLPIADVPKYTDSELSTPTYSDLLGENSKLLLPSKGLVPQNDITNLKDRVETLQEETLTHSEIAEKKKLQRPVNNEPLCADKEVLYIPKQRESHICGPAEAKSEIPDVKNLPYGSAFEVTENQNELCTESLGSMTILGVKENQKSLKETKPCFYSDISAVEISLNDFTEVDTTSDYEIEKPTTELDRSHLDSTDCKYGSKPIETELVKLSRAEADRSLVPTSTILNQSGGTKEGEKDLALYAANKQNLSHVKVPNRQSSTPISTIDVPQMEEKILKVSTTLVPAFTETNISSEFDSLKEEDTVNHDKSTIIYEEIEVLKDSALDYTHISSIDVKGDFKQDEFETKATDFITESQNESISSIFSLFPSSALPCNTIEENIPDITTVPYVRNIENLFPFKETDGFETKATDVIKESQNESHSSVPSPSCALPYNTTEENIPDITTVPYVRNVENPFPFKEAVYTSATDDADDCIFTKDSVAELIDSKTTIPIITNRVEQQNPSFIGEVNSKASVNLIITDTEERPIILNDLNATMEFSTATFEKEGKQALSYERSTSICPSQASTEEKCLTLCEKNIECPIPQILPIQDGKSIEPLIWSSAFTVNENSAISENAFATVVEESQSVLSVTEVEISTPLSVILVEQGPLIFDANTDIPTSVNAADAKTITVVEKEGILYRNANSSLKDKEAVITTEVLEFSKDEAKITPIFEPSEIAEENVILKDMEAGRSIPAVLDDIKERVTVEETGNTYSLTPADPVTVEASDELQRRAYIESFVTASTNNVEDSGNSDGLSHLSDATGNSHPPSKDLGLVIDVRETSILYKDENITLASQHEDSQMSPMEICMWRPSSALTNNAEETADDFKTAETGVPSFVSCEERPFLINEIDIDPLICLSRHSVQEITTTEKENARELGENSSLKQTDDTISADQALAEELTLEQCNLEFHTFMPNDQYGTCSVALNYTAIPTIEHEERRSIVSQTQANIGSTISTTPLSSYTQCTTTSQSEDVEPVGDSFPENIDEGSVTMKQTPNFTLSTDTNMQSEMDLGEVDFASSRLIFQENIPIAKKTDSALEDILQIDLHKNAAEAKASIVNEAELGVSRCLLSGYVAHPKVPSEATISLFDSTVDVNKHVGTDEFGLCVWGTQIHHAKDISASASQRERSELQHEPRLCSRKDTPQDRQRIQSEDVDSHEYENASNLAQTTDILASEHSITMVRHNKFETNFKSKSSPEDLRATISDEHSESSRFSLKDEICKCELVDVLGLSDDDNLKNSSYSISATCNETEIVESINSPLNFCCPEEPHMYADTLDLLQGVNLTSLTTLNSQLYLVNVAVAQQIKLEPYAALHQSSEYNQAEIGAAKQEVLIPNLRDPFQNHTPITIANPEDKLAYNPWTTPLICSTADCSPVRRKQPEVIEEKIACNPWSTVVIEENHICGTPGLKNQINDSLQTLLLNDMHDTSVPVQHPESCDQISETIRLVSEPHSEMKSTTKDAIPEKAYIGSYVHEEDVSIQSCDSQNCKTVTSLSLEIVGNEEHGTCEEQKDRSNSATTVQIAAEIVSKAGKIQCEVQNTTPEAEDCLKINPIEVDDDTFASIISTSTTDEFINQEFIIDLDYKQKSNDSVSLCEKNLGETKSIESNISTPDSIVSTSTPEEFINQEFIRDLDYLRYKQKSKDSVSLCEENLGEIKSIKYNTSIVQDTDKSKDKRSGALFSGSTAKENKDETPKIDIDVFSLNEASIEKPVLEVGSKVNVDLLTDREKQDQGLSSGDSVELEGGVIKLTGKQCSSVDDQSGPDAVYEHNTGTNSCSKTQTVADCVEEEVNDENIEFNVTRNEDHIIESTERCLDCIASIRNVTTDITSDTSDVTRKCFVNQNISEVAFSTNLDEDKKGTPRKDQAVNVTSTEDLADDREDLSVSISNSNAGLNSCILEAQNGKFGKDFSQAKLSPFEDVKIIVLPPSPIANAVSSTTNAELSSSIRERPIVSEQNIFGSSNSPLTRAIENHSTDAVSCLQEDEDVMSAELHNIEDNFSSEIEITSSINEVTPESIGSILGISNDEAGITTSTPNGPKEHNYEDVLHNNDAFEAFEQNNKINNCSHSQNNDILDLHTSRITADPASVKHDVTKYTELNKMVQNEESQIETDINLSEAQMPLKVYPEGTSEGNTSESQTREITSIQGSGATFEGLQQTELFEKKVAPCRKKTNVLATSKQLETQNVGDVLNVTQQQNLEDSAFTQLLRNDEVDVHISLQNENNLSESAISWYYPDARTAETTNKCMNNTGHLNKQKEGKNQGKIEIYETNERETPQTNWNDVLSPCIELIPELANTLKCFKSNENHNETDVSKQIAENEIKSIISPIERGWDKERHDNRFINEQTLSFDSLKAFGSEKEDGVSPEVISNQEYSDTEIFCDTRSQQSTGAHCSLQHDWTDIPYLACRDSLPVYDSSHISKHSNTDTHYAESTVYEMHCIDTEFKILEHSTSPTPPDFGEVIVVPSSRTPEELRFLDATLIDIENSAGMCNELGKCVINSTGARETELGHENEYLELSLDELQSENEIFKHEDRNSNFTLLSQSSSSTLEFNNALILNDSLTAASDDDYNTTCNELVLTSFETCGSRSEEIHAVCFAEAAMACAILDSQPCSSVFASRCPLLAPEDGPVLASSPSQHNVEKGTSFFPDLDDLLSKDFTTYMSSSGDQFHLWPSDVAFGSPSSNLDENIDFDSVLAAPNLEEALRKLEHDIQKRKEEQACDSTTEEKIDGEILDDKYPSVDIENEDLSSSPSLPCNGDDNSLVEEVNLEEEGQEEEDEQEQEEEQENLPDQANGPVEEDNLSYDIGDSDYVSLDDIQSSFKHSPESRDTDDSRNDSSYSAGQREEENEGEASCRNRKLRSFEYSQEEREFRHMQGGSNAVISGFMGPAEREIWGILDGNGDDKDKPREYVVCLEETHNDIVSTENQGISANDDNSDSDENEEEGNEIDWAAALSNIRCYPRVISPGSGPSMSAIEEENEEDISVTHASPVQLSNIQECIVKQGSDGDMTNTVSETRDEVAVLVYMDSQEAKEDTFISETDVVPEVILHSNVEVSCTEEYDVENAETSYDEPVQCAVIEGIECIKLTTTDTINENSDVIKNDTVTYNTIKEHYPLRKTDDVSNINSACLALPPHKSVMENEPDNTTHNVETSANVSNSVLSNNLEVNDKQSLNVNKCSPDNEMQRDITNFAELVPDSNEYAYQNTDADDFSGLLPIEATKSKVKVLKLLFESDCSPVSANVSSDLINSTLLKTTNDCAEAETDCLNSENNDSVSENLISPKMVLQGSKGSGRNSEISTQLEDQTKGKCSLGVTVDIEPNNQHIYEQHLETPLIDLYTNVKRVSNASDETTYIAQPIIFENEAESCTAEADINAPDMNETGPKASMEGWQELQTETCSQLSSVSDLVVFDDALHIERPMVSTLHREEITTSEIPNLLNNISMINLENKDIHKICDSQSRTSKEAIVMTFEMKVEETSTQEDVSTEKFASTVDEIFSEILELDLKDSFDSAEDLQHIIHTEAPDLAAGVNNTYTNYTDHLSVDNRKAISEISADMNGSVIPRQPIITVTEPTNETLDDAAQLEGIMDNSVATSSEMQLSAASTCIARRRQYWDDILRLAIEQKETEEGKVSPQGIQKSPGLTYSEIYRKLCRRNKFAALRSRKPISVRVHGIVNKWRLAFETLKFLEETENKSAEKAERQTGSNVVEQWKKYWDNLVEEQAQIARYKELSKEEITRQYKAGEKRTLQVSGIVAVGRERFEKISSETIEKKCKESIRKRRPRRLERNISSASPSPERISRTNQNVQHDSKPLVMPDTPESANTGETTLLHFNQNVTSDIRLAAEQVPTSFGEEESTKTTKYNSLTFKATITQFEKVENSDSREENFLEIQDKPSTIIIVSNDSLSDASKLQKEHEQSLTLTLERKENVTAGREAIEKDPETKNRFQKAKQFFQMLEQNATSKDSSPAPRHRTTGYRKGKSSIAPSNSREVWGSTVSLVEPQTSRHNVEFPDIRPSSVNSAPAYETNWGSIQSLEDKEAYDNKASKGLHLSPSSSTESLSRCLPFKKLRSPIGGSERCAKVYEKFHVEDLFKDVVGEYGRNCGSLKGIPHQQAVLASLQSVGDRCLSPYDEVGSAATSDDEQPYESSMATSPLPQGYLPEYPYLSTTPARLYRPRSSLVGSSLISRKDLLSVDKTRKS